MSEPKIYVPKCYATERQSTYGPILSIDFSVADLIAFAKEHQTERGYLKLTVVKQKNPSEKSTHSVFLNTWKPDGQALRQAANQPANPPTAKSKIDSADVPDNDEPPF